MHTFYACAEGYNIKKLGLFSLDVREKISGAQKISFCVEVLVHGTGG
jgi:hypothetical protein